MKVLICGSRNLYPLSTDFNIPYEKRLRKHLKKNRIAVIRAMLQAEDVGIIPTAIISGGAVGIDKAAEDYANIYDVPCEVIRPDWHKHGRSAGFVRNLEMLDMCDAVVAIWDGKSKGTKHTIDNANRRKIPLVVYTMVDGEMFYERLGNYWNGTEWE